MAELFHITEVAEFSEAEFAAISAAYESAMAGGEIPRVTSIDNGDGFRTLVDSDGNTVGYCTNALYEHLSNPGHQGEHNGI